MKTTPLDSPYISRAKELLPTRLVDWELGRLKVDPQSLKVS